MPSSTAHDVVVDASATTSGSIAAAATVSLMMLALYVMMRQPRRRGGRFMRSHVYVQIRFESGAAVLAGIAWPDRSGGLSQALALCPIRSGQAIPASTAAPDSKRICTFTRERMLGPRAAGAARITIA